MENSPSINLNKEELFKFIKKRKIELVVLLVMILAFIFRGIFTAILLVVISVAVTLLGKAFRIRRLGIELVTFATVLIGFTYGPWMGLIVGIILESIQTFVTLTSALQIYNLWVIPSFGIAGFVAGTIKGMNIFWLGLGLTLFLHIFFIVTTLMINGRIFPRYWIYLIVNIVLNGLLFYNFGPQVLSML